MLTDRVVVEVIRQRMGWSDSSQAARVIALLPQALKAASRKIAADPYLRQLLSTDPVTTQLPLDANAQIDLTDAYDDFHFLMEMFDLGLIYMLPTLVATVTADCMTALTMSPITDGFADGDVVTFSIGEGGVLPGSITVNTDYTITGLDTETGVFGLSTGAVECDDGGVEWTTLGDGLVYMTRLNAGSGLPMQKLASPNQAPLPNYLDTVFQYYVLQGNVLSIAPPRTGFVSFAVPKYAATLATLPASEECENLFFQILTNLVATPVMEPTV